MSSEILADENRKILREKVIFEKFSTESGNFLETGEKSETGGMHHCLSGRDAPALRVLSPRFVLFGFLFLICV